jgi:hypothetical protein
MHHLRIFKKKIKKEKYRDISRENTCEFDFYLYIYKEYS